MSRRFAFAIVGAWLMLASFAFGQKAKMSVVELDDGNCSVHFRVTHPDKTAVPGALVQVRVKKPSGHGDIVAIRTNGEVRAQFLGLPNSGTLLFEVKDGGHKKSLSYAAADVCGSVADVVIE